MVFGLKNEEAPPVGRGFFFLGATPEWRILGRSAWVEEQAGN